MASKKKQADDAYERGEDQRALVLALDAASQWLTAPWAGDPQEDDRPLRDELEAAITRVRAKFLTVTAPQKLEPGTLPGQMNLLGGAIETCPRCGSNLREFGVPIRSSGAILQCGHCSAMVPVPDSQYLDVVEHRRALHRHTDTFQSPVIPEKKRRSRGAG